MTKTTIRRLATIQPIKPTSQKTHKPRPAKQKIKSKRNSKKIPIAEI